MPFMPATRIKIQQKPYALVVTIIRRDKVKYYILTDQNDQTQNNTQWGKNITHEAKSGKMKLCTDTVIHCYTDPLMASFFNPIHGDFDNPHLWECEVEGEVINDGTKIGCKRLTTTKRIELPEISTEQRITIAIKCAMAVYQDSSFITWAEKWLSVEDRSSRAAYAAAYAARAAYAAAYAAADAAADAAYAAVDVLAIIKEVTK